MEPTLTILMPGILTTLVLRYPMNVALMRSISYNINTDSLNLSDSELNGPIPETLKFINLEYLRFIRKQS